MRQSRFENLVAVQLLKADLHHGRRPHWWFYRDGKGLEIDLLHAEGLRRVAVEVKSGATVQAEWSQGLRKVRERLRARGEDAELWVVHGGELGGSAAGVPAVPWRQVVDWRPV